MGHRDDCDPRRRESWVGGCRRGLGGSLVEGARGDPRPIGLVVSLQSLLDGGRRSRVEDRGFELPD